MKKKKTKHDIVIFATHNLDATFFVKINSFEKSLIICVRRVLEIYLLKIFFKYVGGGLPYNRNISECGSQLKNNVSK